jgi:hypothetical protein
MYEKDGRYYADWRDKRGRRLRKSFTSGRAATRYEAEQKELAHPKKKARRPHSPKSSAPLILKIRSTAGRRATSSRRLAASRRGTSLLHMPSKPTKQ